MGSQGLPSPSWLSIPQECEKRCCYSVFVKGGLLARMHACMPPDGGRLPGLACKGSGQRPRRAASPPARPPDLARYLPCAPLRSSSRGGSRRPRGPARAARPSLGCGPAEPGTAAECESLQLLPRRACRGQPGRSSAAWPGTCNKARRAPRGSARAPSHRPP